MAWLEQWPLWFVFPGGISLILFLLPTGRPPCSTTWHSQAGLPMHNARLPVELQSRLEEISWQTDQPRESRQRIVVAQDEERRRLEPAIRQGAEQQLAVIE